MHEQVCINCFNGRFIVLMEKSKSRRAVSLILLVVSVFVLAYGMHLANVHLISKLPLTLRPLLQLVTYLILLVIPFISIRKNDEILSDFHFEREGLLRQIVIGLVIALIMSLVLIVIPTLVGGRRIVTSQSGIPILYLILSFIFSVSGIGLVEEFIFRGFILKRLQEFVGSLPLIILIT